MGLPPFVPRKRAIHKDKSVNDAKKSVNAPQVAQAGQEPGRNRNRPSMIEMGVNAAIWGLVIVVMGSGTENGIGYFQQPRHSLWLPLIHGALWNGALFFGNVFWLMPRYLHKRRIAAYLGWLLALTLAIIVAKTLGEKLLILAAYPDLRSVGLQMLALENVYIAVAMVVLSTLYRFSRDGLAGSQVVHKVMVRAETRPKSMWIKSGTTRERVRIDDILCVRAADNYVVFELRDRKLMALMSMNTALESLPNECFMRIHRSHIVALDKVESVSTDALVVAGESLPIGRTYRREVQERLARLQAAPGAAQQQ